jgi:uncharacterized membrane protein (UPF0127 family)
MATALTDSNGGTLCTNLMVADKAWSRMKGLLGRRELSPDEGLLLRPASSVHTAFMRFPIDVVFLDRSLRVLDVRADVGPWRAVARKGARVVLELPAGQAGRRGIDPGAVLTLKQVS